MLFATPSDEDTIPENVQMELTEMQCNDILRSKFHAKGISPLEFYRKYLFETGNYTNLADYARRNGVEFWQYVNVQALLKI